MKEEDKLIPKPKVRIESGKNDKPPPMSGMEGPFFFKNYQGGKWLYYDPMEGKHYDRDSDMYTSKSPEAKENDMDGGYEDSLKDNIGDIVMDDSLDAETKIAKLLALVGDTEEEVEGGEDEPMEEAEEVSLKLGDEEEKDEKEEEEKTPLKTEESVRRRKDPAIAKLLEEVDAYRARDRREKLISEARKLCESISLPKYAITEAFLGLLAEADKKNWKTLVEDRRRVIFRGETPVSAVAPNGELTVDSLVKALRS